MRVKVSWVLFLLLFLFLTRGVDASPPSPTVTAKFSILRNKAQLGDQVDLVLRIWNMASSSESVKVEFFLPPQVGIVHGGQPWSGKLVPNETMKFPLNVLIKEEGEYTIGAAVKSESTAGATVNVVATAEGVELSTDPIFMMKFHLAQTPEEQQRLLDATGDGTGVTHTFHPSSGTLKEEQENRYFLNQLQRQIKLQDGPSR